MTKLRIPEATSNIEKWQLPPWLARCVLTGILAGLGGAVCLLLGFGH